MGYLMGLCEEKLTNKEDKVTVLLNTTSADELKMAFISSEFLEKYTVTQVGDVATIRRI